MRQVLKGGIFKPSLFEVAGILLDNKKEDNTFHYKPMTMNNGNGLG